MCYTCSILICTCDINGAFDLCNDHSIFCCGQGVARSLRSPYLDASRMISWLITYIIYYCIYTSLYTCILICIRIIYIYHIYIYVLIYIYDIYIYSLLVGSNSRPSTRIRQVHAIFQTVRALLWASMLLFLINYMCLGNRGIKGWTMGGSFEKIQHGVKWREWRNSPGKTAPLPLGLVLNVQKR